MTRSGTDADTHFYIDNAPPEEVSWVLRSLGDDVALTPAQIAQKLVNDFGYRMQDDKTYSPRRLYDLGLARMPDDGKRARYIISSQGKKVREVLLTNPDFYWDLMHYLHYTLWDRAPSTRKLLWSYRECCKIIRDLRELPPTSVVASGVQNQMQIDFPGLDYTARRGARFDSSAVGRCYHWIGHLVPAPFDKNKSHQPRIVDRYELALLALDHVYRAQCYRYGDPVLLDETLLDQVAAVFFLDLACCRGLLDVAARLTRVIRLADTFAGTSITLLEPYNIERI